MEALDGDGIDDGIDDDDMGVDPDIGLRESSDDDDEEEEVG